MGERVLVVEDDTLILDGIVRNLRYEGYETLVAKDGEEGLRKALEMEPDLVILDVMLPVMGGFDVCRILKKHKPELPVLILTCRSSEDDKVYGLKIGADDYVVKPFSLRELLARVEALLRRKRIYERRFEKVQFADVEIDLEAMTLKKGKKSHRLSPREAKLLKFLLKNAGRTLDRKTILDNVWGYDYYGTARTIDNFIKRLRSKMEDDPENPRFIQTVFGVGYRLVIPQG